MDILSILSKYGILKSYINVVFGAGLFILFLLVGIKLNINNPYHNNTRGTILNVKNDNKGKDIVYVNYAIDDIKYTGALSTEHNKYSKGDAVTVYYDSDGNSTLANPNIINRGGFMIASCGFIILCLFNLNYVFARESKTYSTTIGALNIINDISLLSPVLI